MSESLHFHSASSVKTHALSLPGTKNRHSATLRFHDFQRAPAIARTAGKARKSWENISKLIGIAASVVIACILSVNAAHTVNFNNLQDMHHAKS